MKCSSRIFVKSSLSSSSSSFLLLALLLLLTISCLSRLVVASANDNNNDNDNDNDEWGANLEDHPDPNEENYPGMIYVGKHDEQTGRRIGFNRDNGIRYIFGTSFFGNNQRISIEEKDLLHHPLRPVHEIPEDEREQVLKERRHGTLMTATDTDTDTDTDGASTGTVHQPQPKAFGHVEEHPLDGGVVPPKVVHVDPYFLDETLVTNKEFGKFVRATYYETEAEKYGWSFVLETMVDTGGSTAAAGEIEIDNDPEAEHWTAVDGAYWRRPEGPGSSYKVRSVTLRNVTIFENEIVHVFMHVWMLYGCIPNS